MKSSRRTFSRHGIKPYILQPKARMEMKSSRRLQKFSKEEISDSCQNSKDDRRILKTFSRHDINIIHQPHKQERLIK